MRHLQLQLILVLAAAVSVATLSAILIAGAIRGAETVMIGDTRRTLDAANTELASQYTYRVAGDSAWASLPTTARDISLRAISQATLRSYPGVEGGFATGAQILGYSYPTHGSGNLKIDIPEAERPEIAKAIRESEDAGKAERILRGGRDIVVIESARQGDHASWTMKRLSGIADPGAKRRTVLLIGLVIAALASVIGTLAAVMGLRRGIADIQAGLSRLETDFAFELPVTGGELGNITQSVNRVASARRSLEAALQRAERSRAIGRMAANMAHEIRNPLNGIRLTMQMLKNRLGTGEVRADDLDLVIGEVDRLNALLSELLAFREARAPSLEYQRVLPILERCAGLLQSQARERHIEMLVRADDPNAGATVDAKQLAQVLTNLLLNALHAVPENGTVSVDLRRDREGVTIDVSDTGFGVPAESREHLFEPFYTTRSDGIGLGLAVSRELVSGMGGTLDYRDGSPGAIFSIRLAAEERRS